MGGRFEVSFHTGASLLRNNIYPDEPLAAARDDEALQRPLKPI